MPQPTHNKSSAMIPDISLGDGTENVGTVRQQIGDTPVKTKKTGPGSLDFFSKAVRRDLPNINFHDFIAKQEFEFLPYSKRTNLTIATVGCDYTNLSLDQNANVVPLGASNWLDMLEQSADISFLLIESAYVYADANWLSSVAPTFDGNATAKNNNLLALIETCHKRHIPSVFWYQEEPEQARSYLSIAQSVDYAFATSKASIKAFKTLTANPQFDHLPTAIEPRLFNPFRVSKNGHSEMDANFYICFDKFRELSDGNNDSVLAKMLKPALDYNFWIFESRFDMRANSARLAEFFKRRFLGCFSTAGRSYIYKMSDISLQFSSRSIASSMDERHILEAIASKALVLTNLTSKGTVFDGLVLKANDPDEVHKRLGKLSNDRAALRKLRHVAYRNVLQNHTFFNRLQKICSVIGIPETKLHLSENPKISVIMPTRRPELIPFALNNFRQQTYEALELIIVLHGEDFDSEIVKNLIQKNDNIRLVSVPARQSVSTALNTGIGLSNGEYFARMDDDDYYAPNYFTDAMLSKQFVDFDISGKAQWMVYFEETDKIALHKGDTAAHSQNPAIAGGTFLVRNNSDAPVWFCDRVQGYADVDFIGRNIVEKDKILITSDPFNFVQIRRTDPESHTWTIQHDKFDHGEIICDGFDFETFAI